MLACSCFQIKRENHNEALYWLLISLSTQMLGIIKTSHSEGVYWKRRIKYHIPSEGTTHPVRDKMGNGWAWWRWYALLGYFIAPPPPTTITLAAGLRVWGMDMSKKSLAQNPDGHKTCCGEQNEVSRTGLIAYSSGDGGIRKQPDQWRWWTTVQHCWLNELASHSQDTTRKMRLRQT